LAWLVAILSGVISGFLVKGIEKLFFSFKLIIKP